MTAQEHGAHSPDCASHDRLHDPGPEGEGTFDERGWYRPPCDCSEGHGAYGSHDSHTQSTQSKGAA